MKYAAIGNEWKISLIEWAALPGERARSAGCNARLGVHGKHVTLPVAKITIEGCAGFGWSRIGKEDAAPLLDVPVREMFEEDGTVKPPYRKLEFPLLDWLGHIENKPVYQLFAKKPVPDAAPLLVPCYDTSLYFDDLHLEDDDKAVELMQREAAEGKARGHTNFKIKVGRGARHMPLDQGTRRDIAIIKGIRQAAGADGKIMIDANNGYNLNLAKEVLAQTAGEHIYWIEEAFHEDSVLYGDLKEWLQAQRLDVLIADGEGNAAAPLVNWAKQGFVDVLQYDILHPGFSFWVNLSVELDAHGVKTSPHHYGAAYGNYASGHLAAAAEGFQFIEWDEVKVDGLDSSSYRVERGTVQIPAGPGFGLALDDRYFSTQVKEAGWTVSRQTAD